MRAFSSRPAVRGTPDWSSLAESVRRAPNVTGAAPFIEIEALAVRKPDMVPCDCAASIPTHEGEVARIAKSIVEGRLADLTPGSDRVIVGRGIAQMLGLGVGDPITVLVPTTDANGAP